MRNGRGQKRKTMPTKYSLFILSGCCIVFFILSLTLNISGGPLQNLAGYIFVPMQNGINSAGEWLLDQTNEFRTLSEVLDENEQLKAQVDDLTEQLTSLTLEQYELEQLRALYDLDESYPSYEKVAASVVATDSSNWFDTFTINRGTSDGVEVGMNVMADGGLVGIVTEAGDNYALVRSIIDDSSNVSAMILSTGDNFNVSGDLESMSEFGVITFSELQDDEDQVQIGDAVVTSYVSDQYKQGILIGYIASIEENSNQLTKNGTITPAVDFKHLQMVLVITDTKAASEIQTTDPSADTESATSEDDTDGGTEPEEDTENGTQTSDDLQTGDEE